MIEAAAKMMRACCADQVRWIAALTWFASGDQSMAKVDWLYHRQG
jgi:hypothetical protein